MELALFRNLLNVALAVMVASFVILFVTTATTPTVNSTSAQLGGYIGLMASVLFVFALCLTVSPINDWMSVSPLVSMLIVLFLLTLYVTQYFDSIAHGHVSTYYSSFSWASLVFMTAQLGTMMNSLFRYEPSSTQTQSLFPNKSRALLSLYGIINGLIVVSLGITLKFYSTQG